MKRKWVKGVVAAGVIGCLLAGCASAKPAHLDGLDKLGAIEVVTREEGSGTRSTFAEKAGIVDAATGMDQTTKDSVAAAGNEDVLQKVEKDPNAIKFSNEESKQTYAISIKVPAIQVEFRRMLPFEDDNGGKLSYTLNGTLYPDEQVVIYDIGDVKPGTEKKRRGRRKKSEIEAEQKEN